MMTPQEGCESILRKFCMERLEKDCLMDLFLIKDAYSSNSAMMDWNGPNFSFGSVANGLFHTN